jgi:hypothetical protein
VMVTLDSLALPNHASAISGSAKARGVFLQIPTSKAMMSFIWRRQRPLSFSIR